MISCVGYDDCFHKISDIALSATSSILIGELILF